MGETDGLYIELTDGEWPFVCTDHDRQIVRAVVYDREGFLYFVHADRDDDFGRCENIETSGGGVDPGESEEEALRRELREELGAEVTVTGKIGTVSDYYNLLCRHNISTYYLCRAESFGDTELTDREIEDFHLSVIRLTFPEAYLEYERYSSSPLGRLIAARELPILRRAEEMLSDLTERI